MPNGQRAQIVARKWSDSDCYTGRRPGNQGFDRARGRSWKIQTHRRERRLSDIEAIREMSDAGVDVFITSRKETP